MTGFGHLFITTFSKLLGLDHILGKAVADFKCDFWLHINLILTFVLTNQLVHLRIQLTI
jgi:hypothetical protein